MVSWNGSVKVLGYYLSEEERALKRQWSMENHLRMVEVKRKLRRKALQQRQCGVAGACDPAPVSSSSSSSSSPFSIRPLDQFFAAAPRPSGGLEKRPAAAAAAAAAATQHHHATTAIPAATAGKTGAASASAGMAAKQHGAALHPGMTSHAHGRILFSASTDRPHAYKKGLAAASINLERSLEDASQLGAECHAECDRFALRLCSLVAGVSSAVMTRVHAVASAAVDKDDAAALNALRNLLIPPLE